MNRISQQQHTVLNIHMIFKPILYYDTIIIRIREIRYEILLFFRDSFPKNNEESKEELIQLKLKLSKLKKEILSYMSFVENENHFYKEILEAKDTKDLDFHLKKINTKLSKSNNNEFIIFKINLECFNFDSKFEIDRKINECVIFVWEKLVIYIYIYKYNLKNEYTYKILDIVITTIMDKGSNNTFTQKINQKLNVFEIGNQNYNQILKKNFENEFKELVFMPESKLFQKITSTIRKIYFSKIVFADFEVLILNVLDYYTKVFKNENKEWNICGICKKILIFDSINNGFLCCTLFRNGDFYHEKCLNL